MPATKQGRAINGKGLQPQAHRAIVALVVDAGQAANAGTPEVDDPGMAQVVNVWRYPAPIVELPQVVGRLVVPANCTLQYETSVNRALPMQMFNLPKLGMVMTWWELCAQQMRATSRQARRGLRTEQGGVGGHGLAGVIAVEALQVSVLGGAGQTLEVVQVPHSLGKE